MKERIGVDNCVEEPERAWVIECGSRYWHDLPAVEALPVPKARDSLGLRFVRVELPSWAADLGVGSPPSLAVDSGSLVGADGVDWWTAAFRFLTGAAERRHEFAAGPVHSYAFRLRGIDAMAFENAWVNRIMLFLQRWSMREAGAKEIQPPRARFDLTHDVDAVRKTPELRFKQGAFEFLNAGRLMVRRRPVESGQRLAAGIRFAARGGELSTWHQIRALETQCSVKSTFHVYAGPAGRQRKGRALLLDPAYDVASLTDTLRLLRDGGWTIGLHPGFDAWRDTSELGAQREILERVVGASVQRCRQHWLRFSWAETWEAQEQAGLRLDSTLGFNDRPGFRNGAALRFRPWNFSRRAPLGLEVIPLVLMDSHLYDYELLDDRARQAEMRRWVDEVAAVGGEASFLWHQQTIHPDYGWLSGYRELLQLVSDGS
ncbi:MAG TPA: hypothetical protein VIG47_00390 [Gemmatimonadaceae bacterium]|jgi:hypothetical protein